MKDQTFIIIPHFIKKAKNQHDAGLSYKANAL
jgi:hypothetical protein